MDADYFLEMFELMLRDTERGARAMDDPQAQNFRNPFDDRQQRREQAQPSGSCKA